MKLKYVTQQFQIDAVNAVCDLFIGQEQETNLFSVETPMQTSFLQNELGVGNVLRLRQEELMENMHRVQREHGLPCTPDLEKNQFSIEMETGTGKTYVYTRTILELHARYGFTKFIIVVPSVAIREGVYKSLQMTQEHFASLYHNVPYHFFIYNSTKPTQVRQFAQSDQIEIMIINIDAFRKSENVINQNHEKLNDKAAIEYIQATCPIVIIDESQSVDTTQKAKEAIASLNPLCILRYSATLRERINLLYRLTPVEAYEQGLVKQIRVASNRFANGFNTPYIRLVSVSNEEGFQAKLEIDMQDKNGKVARKTVTVRPDTDLFLLSGNRELYSGYTVAGIDCTPGMEGIEFSNTQSLELGSSIGDIDERVAKKLLIRRTIEFHLDKELRYHEKGIKVLSLFFIDRVDRYRGEEGKKGLYAQLFEECYAELMGLPKYAPLRNWFPKPAEQVHNGYFSQDKKGRLKDTRGDSQDDYSTYNAIMRDKEWLLSFDCPLRFIFSHSALKEGWDNPNVFQVCTLIDQKSPFTCRQKIGRGLRLCVNQDGERITDRNINTLHVMANETFSEFAAKLQSEMEDETGIRFGVLQMELFSGLTYFETVNQKRSLTQEQSELIFSHLVAQGLWKPGMPDPATLPQPSQPLPAELEPARVKAVEIIARQGSLEPEQVKNLTCEVPIQVEKQVSYEDAKELLLHFEQMGYISKEGKIQDSMKRAVANGTLNLPNRFEGARNQVEEIVRQTDHRPPVWNADHDVTVTLNLQKLKGAEFQEIWNSLRHMQVYRVHVNETQLIDRGTQALQEMPSIAPARMITQMADLTIDLSGVTHVERGIKTSDLQDSYQVLPNIIAVLGEQTQIKRKTLYEILKQCERLPDFVKNPQLFLEQSAEILRSVRDQLAIQGISYVPSPRGEYHLEDLFPQEESTANVERNAVAVTHSLWNYALYESTIERNFIRDLEDDDEVKLFFKLPDAFKLQTPVGTYTPDWVIYWEREGNDKKILIIETKGSTVPMEQRGRERMKIQCGKVYFRTLDPDIGYYVATNWKKFKEQYA